MMERRQIVDAARTCGRGVLVTLVRTEGSSYRQTGARLLSPSGGGGHAGTISGGCLEAEVVKKAAWKVSGGPVVERYSTLFDDTTEIPFGLGCGGTVDLLFEQTGTAECTALLAALESSLGGAFFTVVTWLPGEDRRLARAVLSSEGSIHFASSGISQSDIEHAIRREADDFESAGIFVEQLLPPQRLIILGAGDDAKPLVDMAALLGWSVIVADGRSQFASAERFPKAQQVLLARAGDAGALGLEASDAVVLMTHSYEQDREWLAAVLPIAPRYFGVLGAKHRSSLLVSEAAKMTGLPLDTCCERIYAPVGLDLGGDGPEAIALAVIAEAHARCMGRLGRSLRLSASDVSAQVEQGGASRYLQAQCAPNPAEILR